MFKKFALIVLLSGFSLQAVSTTSIFDKKLYTVDNVKSVGKKTVRVLFQLAKMYLAKELFVVPKYCIRQDNVITCDNAQNGVKFFGASYLGVSGLQGLLQELGYESFADLESDLESKIV